MLAKLSSLVLVFVSLFQASAETQPSEFPFRFSEGLLWVQAHIWPSGQTLDFLLDSGASASVLNLSAAEKLGLRPGKKLLIQGIHSSVKGYWSPKLSVKASEVWLPQDYVVVDLAKTSGLSGRQVDGLIGADFFRGRVVQIDFAASKVRVLESAAGSFTRQMIPLKMSDTGAFLLSAQINRSPRQLLRLDTGCASSLQWAAGKASARYNEQLSVGLARTSIGEIFTTVEAGEVSFDSVPTGLHRKRLFPGEAGLIGNGLLRRFVTVTIDAKTSRLLLETASADSSTR